jgi:hypothetical protein
MSDAMTHEHTMTIEDEQEQEYWTDPEAVSEQEHLRLVDEAAEHEAVVAAEADAVERENEYDGDTMFDHHFAEPAPDPDAGLFRLIAKYHRLAADNDRRAEALFWELICRDAQTVAGFDAKASMVRGSKFAGPHNLVALAFRLGHEAGKLGLSRTVPGFLMPITKPGSR